MSVHRSPPQSIHGDEEAPENARRDDPLRNRYGAISRAETETPEETGIYSAKLIKLPPFWRDNPTLWFMQVEASFTLSRITSDDSKYRYVLVNLDTTVLPFMSDIVTSPPATNKYDVLKRRIIDAFGKTSETKLRRLLRNHELTDDKPSNFLQKLRNLAGVQCSDIVLRTLFLEQLPDNVRSILAISEVGDLSKLALQADKVLDMSKINISQVCLSTSDALNARKPESTSEITELKASVEALAKQFKKLQTGRRRSRSRSRNRPHYRNKSPATKEHRGTDICYYHTRFGKEAYHCLTPCKWKKEDAEN
ncbi:uncharacterized protein LOC112638642 [Camponotus floridanus]|uniref:uncharacterized protein LOC112638642 n=1 Tax=Camponotus floridanus TaxID=104421 RepID=UPI000DC68F6E|nr:uncharacterized protein LOC112638642 [Camponotus floridanus]